MSMLERLQAMLDQGQDNLLLRFGLGNEHFKAGHWQQAEAHLRAALEHDANYSAAWKLLGRSLASAGQHAQAIEVLRQGVQVAESKGDIQAAKEMKVFLKRSEKALAEPQ